MTVAAEQLVLIQPVVGRIGATIDEQFRAFHEANPWVLTVLERETEQWLARGHRHLGIGLLWERLRWIYQEQTADPTSTFKANNNYRSRYVRLMLERHPEWVGVFTTRELSAP